MPSKLALICLHPKVECEKRLTYPDVAATSTCYYRLRYTSIRVVQLTDLALTQLLCSRNPAN